MASAGVVPLRSGVIGAMPPPIGRDGHELARLVDKTDAQQTALSDLRVEMAALVGRVGAIAERMDEKFGALASRYVEDQQRTKMTISQELESTHQAVDRVREVINKFDDRMTGFDERISRIETIWDRVQGGTWLIKWGVVVIPAVAALAGFFLGHSLPPTKP